MTPPPSPYVLLLDANAGGVGRLGPIARVRLIDLVRDDLDLEREACALLEGDADALSAGVGGLVPLPLAVVHGHDLIRALALEHEGDVGIEVRVGDGVGDVAGLGGAGDDLGHDVTFLVCPLLGGSANVRPHMTEARILNHAPACVSLRVTPS